MKKTVAALLCLLLMFGLFGCGKGIDIEEEDVFKGNETAPYTKPVTSAKTAFNYLTGEMNMAEDRVGMRPYCISVNNVNGSWPQYGISKADILMEMETEGGITRMLALYTDLREVERIGSVRSLRNQMIMATNQIDPIIVHIGTSIYADKMVAENNIKSLDGDINNQLIWFDNDRYSAGYASEYCKFTSGGYIDDVMADKGIPAESSATVESFFKFTDAETPVELSGGDAKTVNFKMTESTSYDGDFRYDEATGTYLKFQRGEKQVDGLDNSQVAFTNVLVLFAKTTVIDQKAQIVDIDFQGGGEGYYFSNGKFEKITWVKDDLNSGYTFTKEDGTELVMNIGKTCVCIGRSTNVSSMKIA